MTQVAGEEVFLSYLACHLDGENKSPFVIAFSCGKTSYEVNMNG